MAKGEQKSNREKKKPKADKLKTVTQASPFAPAPGVGKNKGATGKKPFGSK